MMEIRASASLITTTMRWLGGAAAAAGWQRAL